MKNLVRGICLGLVLVMMISMSAFAAEISAPAVTVDKDAKTADVSVTVTDPAADQYVTILVIKNTANLASVSENDIAYVDQEKAVDGNVTFKLGVDTAKFGEKFTVYVGGTGVAAPKSASLSFSNGGPGDADGDGMVNIKDYNLIIGAFGSALGGAAYNDKADLNSDGMVNIKDYNIVIENFGKTY